MGWIGTEFGARWSVAVSGIVVLLTAFCSVIIVSRNSSLTFRNQVRTVFVRKLDRARHIGGGSDAAGPR
jgi:hypothetical protein